MGKKASVMLKSQYSLIQFPFNNGRGADNKLNCDSYTKDLQVAFGRFFLIRHNVSDLIVLSIN
jgi:hypothetical protein